MEPGAAASSTLPLLALPSGDTLKFRKRQNDLNEQEEEALRRQLRQHIGAAAVLPSNKQPKPKNRTARDTSVCEPLTGNSSSSSSGSIDALDPTSLTALWSSASVWNVSELLKLVQRLLWVSDEDMAEEIDESDPKFIAGKKFLGGVEAFAMLTENELAQLVGLSQFRTFHGGDVVIEDEREADGLYIVLTGTASRFAATNGVIDNDGSPLDTFAYQEHFGSIISPSEAGPTADRMETTVIASSDILECIWLPELVVRMLNIQPRMEYEFVLILNNPPYGADEDAQQTVLLNLLRAGLHVTVLANTRNTRNYVVLLLSAPLWLLAREDKLMVMERIIENHAEEDTRNVGDDYEYHAETMTASDRIAAFASILTRSPSDKPPGAGIRGIEQNQDPIVRDVFPLHDPSMTDFILTSWFTETQPNSLKRLFLLRIKDYFGLRIAFFAAFVRLYNAALVYPSNAGAVLWIFWRWIDYRSYVKAVGIYGLCVAFIWAPSFLKRWRRYQNSLLVEWNLLGTTEVEQPNPEFRDYVVESINVSNDGEPPDYVEVKSYDHRRRWPKYLIFGVFCLLCLVMLFAFVGVYVQWYIIAVMTPMCTNPRCPEYRNIDGGCVDHCQELFAQGKSYLFMSAIDSCADYCNTTAFDTTYYRCDAALVGCFHTERGILGTARWFYVLVQGIVLGLTLDIVFLALFETIAQGFNRWENYPTEQESERRLIEKIFLFNWVGYFYWFFLLAFVYVPNGADVQSLIRKHVDTNRLLTLNDSLKFSRYWIDGLISMDSAFVTPMIVTQALNLVINTFVPYLLRRAIIRARDSYHVKKDRLLQLGKHAPRKLLATAKRAATVGANGATANGGDSISGVWEDIVDDVPISGYNLFAEDQQDDPTDAWLPVVPPGEDQTMNRHELSHLLAARVPIAARNMERAVHDLFGNLAAHETHMTDICGELTKDDMDMYQLTSFNWLDRVTRKMEDAGHLRDFWDATTGSSDDSSSSQQGKGSSGGSGRHWKIALITSWQCRNYNYTADRILEESSMSTYSPFGDLLHLAIQFSYTIMFSVVWPFCCLCSFCRNAVALRFDAIKMTIDCKRAVPRRTVGIGSWLTAFLFEITIAQIIVPALFVYVSGQFDAFFSDCTISESRYGPAANECLTATQRLVAFCSLENAGVAVCLLVYAKKSAISNETTIKIVAHSRKLRHNLRKSVRMIGESILVSSPPVRIASSSPVGKTESSSSSLLYKQHRDHHHHGDMLDDSEDPSAMFSVDLHPPVGVVGGALHRRRPHGSGHSSRMDLSSSSLSTSSGLNGDQAREWREGTVSWVKNGRIKVNFSGGRQLSDGAMRGTATQSKNEEVWLTNSESHVLMVPTPVKIFEIGMPVLLASPTRFGRWIEATITRMDNRDRFGVELTAVPNEMHLRVVEAQNLRVSTLRHTSAVLVDPYCVVTVGTYFRHATSTKRRALNPVWDEAVVFPLSARDLYGAPTPGNASGLHQAAAGSGSARTNSRLGSASSSTPPNRAAEVTPTPPPPPAPVRTIKFSVHNNDPLAMNECLGAVELDLQQLRTGGQRHRLLVPLSHKRHRWTLDAIQNVMRKQAMGATDYPVLGMPHLLVELQWIDTRLPSRVLVRAQGESKELELSRKFCETHLCYGIQEGLINQGPISTT